jgi:hypothetical protein
MRTTLLALTLSGCVVGNELVDRPDLDLQPAPTSTVARGMEALEQTPNLGHGVVAGVDGPEGWLGMGDRICLVEGASGAVTVDVWLDGVSVPGLALLDVDGDTWLVTTPVGVVVTGPSGDAGPVAYVAGDVVGGALTDDGAVLRVMRDGACELVATDFMAVPVRHPVDAALCGPDVDLVAWQGGALVGGGPEIRQLAFDGLLPLAPGDQLALDVSSGALFAGFRGERQVQVTLDDSSYDLGLSGALVDLAAADGQVVALVETGELVRFDVRTGFELDRAPYEGPLGVTGMQMTDSGRGLLITTPQMVQFYRLGRPDPSMTAAR